jgi:non-ribosomal peptide synthase protein (TIGR01720 family)
MINPLKISKGEIKPWDIEFEDSAEKIISVIDGVQENINAQLEQIKIEILTESGERMRIAIVVRDTTITDLFILSHPIFFDTQSISLLITELFIAYSHAQGDDRLKVPFMTVTYSQFLTDLAEFYQSDRFEHSRQYWQVTDPIMSDLDGSRWNNKVLIVGKVPHRIIRNRMKLETWLSEDESSQLSKALSIYRTSFEEFMLTAVLSEFARFIDQERIFINIRRNMRHPDIRGLLGIDTGNIIGNLEFTFPILIDIGKDPLHIVGKIHPIGKMLISVKDQLLSVPDYGLGFSLLKYWGDQNQLENSNSNLLVPLISFQADQNQSPSFDMIGYQFYPGHVHSPITITATARDNKSGLLWDFDVNMVREGAIREIAENTIQQTKELISHCLSADAGGLSTSDLQVFGWSPDDLTDIISALNGE